MVRQCDLNVARHFEICALRGPQVEARELVTGTALTPTESQRSVASNFDEAACGSKGASCFVNSVTAVAEGVYFCPVNLELPGG
jgi:hypothetical protein